MPPPPLLKNSFAIVPFVHRMDGRVAGREDVDRFMRSMARIARIVELTAERLNVRVVDRHAQIALTEVRQGISIRVHRARWRRSSCRRRGLNRRGDGGRLDRRWRVEHGPRRMAAQRPAESKRGDAASEHGSGRPPRPPAPLHWKMTGVPFVTSAATRAASQFVRRTQPCDSACPTRPGSGVPCRP